MSNTTTTQYKASQKVNEVIRKSMEFPMDKVVFRYRREYRLSEFAATEHERELKRFLALCACSNKAYGMRGPVDNLWHTFIVFTHIYARFSREVAGRFIHHYPNVIGYVPSDGEEEPLNLRAEAYQEFLTDYKTTFGETPPQHIWPQATTASGEYAADCGENKDPPGTGDCGNDCDGTTGGD
jgi:hypothetical protein